MRSRSLFARKTEIPTKSTIRICCAVLCSTAKLSTDCQWIMGKVCCLLPLEIDTFELFVPLHYGIFPFLFPLHTFPFSLFSFSLFTASNRISGSNRTKTHTHTLARRDRNEERNCYILFVVVSECTLHTLHSLIPYQFISIFLLLVCVFIFVPCAPFPIRLCVLMPYDDRNAAHEMGEQFASEK